MEVSAPGLAGFLPAVWPEEAAAKEELPIDPVAAEDAVAVGFRVKL